MIKIMKSIYLFFIFLFSSVSLLSQNSLYDIKQAKDSEPQIIEFVKNMELNENYTFAVLLPLGMCPSCEGVIPLFFKQADEVFPNEDKILFVINNDYEETLDYLSGHNYGVDKISILPYDSDFLELLCFTTDNIGVPYLMLINNKTGVIVNAVSTLGLEFSDSFFDDFVYDIDRKRIALCENIISHRYDDLSIIPFENIIEDFDSDIETFTINNTDSIITSIYKYTVSNSADKIAVIDYLTQNIAILTFDNGEYYVSSVIKPTEVEMRMFKDENVGEEMYQFLKLLNIPNIFYLDIAFVENDNSLLYTASLPKIYWEDIVNEQLAYLNQACFIKRKITDLNDVEYTVINTNSVSDFSHSDFYFNEITEEVYFPVLKGWPVKGTTSAPENDNDNPAIDSFYDSCYSVVKYGPDGEFKDVVLKLPEWHKDNRTGYFFFKPLVKFDDNCTYIIDTFTSIIYVLDVDDNCYNREINLTQLLNVEVTENNLLLNDSLDQLQTIQSKKKLLPLSVLDMIPYKSDLYLLLLYNDERFYLKLDKNDNILNMYVLPDEFQKNDLSNIRLFVGDSGVSLMSLCCKNNSIKVLKLSL